MRKGNLVFIAIIISVILHAQLTTFEHRNITNAPEAMEIIDSFLVCTEGKFIEVYNADGDTLISRNIIDFGEYAYDIKYDDKYIFISPWFLGDSIRVFYRDSLPSLVEYCRLFGYMGFDVNDSLFVSGVTDTLIIYNYDSTGIFSEIVNEYISSIFWPCAPAVIYDTFYLPDISIADIYAPYEIFVTLQPYIIEDTIAYSFAFYFLGFATFNIADMDNIILLDTIFIMDQEYPPDNPSGKVCMMKLNDYLYVNCTGDYTSNNDFMIFNVADPADVIEINNIHYDIINYGRQARNDLAVYGDNLFFSKSELGLQIYDLNDTVSPVFNYAVGTRPLDHFIGMGDYNPKIRPMINDSMYYMADDNGIYFCKKNDWAYESFSYKIEGLNDYAYHDSVIAVLGKKNSSTMQIKLMDLSFTLIDSVEFSIDPLSYSFSSMIPVDNCYYVKQRDDTGTSSYICQRDSLNHLTIIDTFDNTGVPFHDYIIDGNNLIIYESGSIKKYNIKDPAQPALLAKINASSRNHNYDFIAMSKQYLFLGDDCTDNIYCYEIKEDTFIELWQKNISLDDGFSGLEFCNGYLIVFPQSQISNKAAKLYTFDETGILDSIISYDFSGALGQSVVESNYVYFPELGSMFNRVRVGDKKQECIVPDSMHIGAIASGDSMLFTIPVFNNGDAVLNIDSVKTSAHTFVRTAMPVAVSPRDTVNIDIVSYQYTGTMKEYVDFYTDDLYDLYNETVITAEQLAGLDMLKPEKSILTDFAEIQQNRILYTIGSETDVCYSIIDVSGRVVHKEISGTKPGTYMIELDKGLLSGIYFVEFTAGDIHEKGKITILK